MRKKERELMQEVEMLFWRIFFFFSHFGSKKVHIMAEKEAALTESLKVT